MIDKSVNYFLILIVAILPFAIITGPFIPDLIIVLTSIAYLFFIFKEKKVSVLNNLYIKYFVAIWCYLIFSSLLSNEILFSLKSSFFYIRFGVFCLIVYYLCSDEKFIDFFTLVFFITFFIIIADSLLQFFSGKNFFGYPSSQDGSRLTSFFKDEYIVGSYISRSFPLMVSLLLLYLEKNYNKYIHTSIYLLFIIVPLVVFLTGERSAFFYVIFYFFLMLFFFGKKFKFIYLIFLFSLIIMAIFINKYESVNKRMIKNFFSETGISSLFINKKKSLQDSNPKININIFSEIHEGHIKTAINIFKHNKLFGSGPNTFRHECSNKNYAVTKWNCTTHPHNFHIQILSETGIVGYMIFLIIFINLLFILIKFFFRNNNNSYANISYISLIAGMIVTLQPITTNGNFFNNYLSIMIYLPVGFAIYIKKKYDF